MRIRGRKREAAALAIGVVAMGGVIAVPVASASTPAHHPTAGAASVTTLSAHSAAGRISGADVAKATKGHGVAIRCTAVNGGKGPILGVASGAVPKELPAGAVTRVVHGKATESGKSVQTFKAGKTAKGLPTIKPGTVPRELKGATCTTVPLK